VLVVHPRGVGVVVCGWDAGGCERRWEGLVRVDPEVAAADEERWVVFLPCILPFRWTRREDVCCEAFKMGE
jgi:hypothetical protein